MPYEYNPLLKENLQKSNSSEIEREIDALQSAVDTLQSRLNTLQTNLNELKGNKITKVTATAQLSDIENDEIFEWQCESQTVDGVDYVNGYFYKKSQSGQVVTIPTDQPCFDYNSTSLYARGTIDFHDYSLPYDTYYVAGELQPENSNLTSIDCRTFGNGRYYALFVESSLTCVSSIVFDTYELVSIGVTRCFYDENNRYALTLELENGITVAADSGSFGRLSVIWDCYSTNGNHIAVLPWSLVGSQKYLLADYSISGNTVTINDWTLFGATESTTAEPITIDTTVVTYSRTDTQPNNSYTLPTAAANVLGGVKVGNNLSIDANGVLSASGSSYTLPKAAANVLGGVKVGSGLSIDANGVLSSSGGGNIPMASYNVLGGVKVNNYGDNIHIKSDGIIVADPYFVLDFSYYEEEAFYSREDTLTIPANSTVWFQPSDNDGNPFYYDAGGDYVLFRPYVNISRTDQMPMIMGCAFVTFDQESYYHLIYCVLHNPSNVDCVDVGVSVSLACYHRYSSDD